MGNRSKPEKEEVEGETPAANTENAETTPAAEEKKEETPAEEEVKEEVKPQEEEEEEDTGITLDDFLANRKTAGIKNKVRDNEKTNMKNIQENTEVKVHQTTIAENLQGKDTYATRTDAYAHLFGFQGGDDFEESAPSRGGRGGRGGRGAARGGRGGRGGRSDRPDTNRGGKRRGGNKLVVDDNAFPTL
mmetsp:Transcript_55628/g.76474  ORF Transcript_55628/g.76474 Transcript_55628/m.76474 type:complete len:189 (-) Transcript_55628:159-725(-)